mmetsp:Transcript_12599/g.18925  ORF Transcript_12599/g.18925 Transcript_12599/m.18925 type:complete len:413 (-) Transcript_12599:225-1463(-)
MRSEEDRNVSEDMLRMVVDEATTSSEGIETGEGRMIKAVLDMQDKEVSKIMQPRVDIVALPELASATEILQTAVLTKYSRIPVYRGDIDDIIGIIFSKDLLDYILAPTSPDAELAAPVLASSSNPHVGAFSPRLKDDWSGLSASKLLEPTYYIPETMSCWNALQEMRKRRLHMAIVVDEYGGTSGLVTFEDILEEVVGEIYDEDDDDEESSSGRAIFKRANGSFRMKGSAELDDMCEALGIDRDEVAASLGEYSTVGGLLCSIAGMIPKAGDQIEFAGFGFTVLEVEDNRRVTSLLAAPLANPPTSPLASSNGGVSEGLSDSVGVGVLLDEGVNVTAGGDLLVEEPLPVSSSSLSSAVEAAVDPSPSSTSPLSTDSSLPSPPTPASSQSQQENDVLIFRDGEWQDSTASVDR